MNINYVFDRSQPDYLKQIGIFSLDILSEQQLTQLLEYTVNDIEILLIDYVNLKRRSNKRKKNQQDGIMKLASQYV